MFYYATECQQRPEACGRSNIIRIAIIIITVRYSIPSSGFPPISISTASSPLISRLFSEFVATYHHPFHAHRSLFVIAHRCALSREQWEPKRSNRVIAEQLRGTQNGITALANGGVECESYAHVRRMAGSRMFRMLRRQERNVGGCPQLRVVIQNGRC